MLFPALLLAGTIGTTACARDGQKDSAMNANDSVTKGRTIDDYTYTDAPVEARLGPHVFRFPANYYRDQMGPNFDGSFSLLVQWPDLQPLPPGERSGQDMATFDRQITIAPAYVDRVPIEGLMNAMTVPIAEPGSVESDDPRKRIDLMLPQPGQHGITPYLVDTAKLADFARRYRAEVGVATSTDPRSYQDWFAHRDAAGNWQTLIRCNHEPEAGTAERPGCTHDFTIPELRIAVSMDYAREYLAGWQRIELRARALIDQYRAH